MAFDITIRDNYLEIVHENGTITDRPAKDLIFAKRKKADVVYTVFDNEKQINGLKNIQWDSFTLDSVAFANAQAFEDWKNENTGG